MDPVSLESWLSRLAPEDPPSSVESSGGSGLSKESLLLSVARPAMACQFEVLANQHQYPQATEHAVSALDLIEQLERLFSVYKPHSDLSTLNRLGAQRPVALSEDTARLLELAKAVHRWTDRAFDVTSGSLSEAWGFSRRQGRKPTEEVLQESLQRVGSEHLELNVVDLDTSLKTTAGAQAPDQRTARLLRRGVTVNPGGIGKGYALDRAAGHLGSCGMHDFMIHGGLSSVVARGHRQHPDTGGGWLVSLKHPWRWEEHLGTIRLRDRALGTSGSGKQFFHFGGQRYSHIIDPRTGWPAQSMMSATVVCRSGAIADALATAFFVLGPEATQAFCNKHPQISAILIYLDEQQGQPKLDTFNVTEDMWQPGRPHEKTI